MDTPENYYAILGVPVDTDEDTLKRAYRQLARRSWPLPPLRRRARLVLSGGRAGGGRRRAGIAGARFRP